MHILMTADTVGGVWTYALDLARTLGAHNTHVTLATMGKLPSEEQRAAATEIPNLRLRSLECRLEWMDDPWADIARSGEWLRALEAETRPDIVHLNGYAHGDLPWRAPTVLVAHSCVCSWWRAVKGEPAPDAAWGRYREMVRTGLNAADLLVAPTRAMARALAVEYGPLGSDVHVVPNGRDASAFRADIQKEPFVLAAGRLWDEAKNIAALAAIAPRLLCPIRVAGDAIAPGADSGKSARGPSLESLGFLDSDTLACWMSRAALYALPARYEPFGLSILEAALSGCALVLGDIPSLREVWADTAFFVPPNDANALLRALDLLLANPIQRAALAASSRERARLYTPGRAANAYSKIYRSLSGNGKETQRFATS